MKSDTEGLDVMEAEAKAIRLAGGRLGAEFEAALDVFAAGGRACCAARAGAQGEKDRHL